MATHFPPRLSVGPATAVHNFDKSDMSNYIGITVNSVLAELFTMILEQRIALRAEEHAVKAKGQAGFRKDFRRTANIFLLSHRLTNNDRHDRQEKLANIVDFRKAFAALRAELWQLLEELGVWGNPDLGLENCCFV